MQNFVRVIASEHGIPDAELERAYWPTVGGSDVVSAGTAYDALQAAKAEDDAFALMALGYRVIVMAPPLAENGKKPVCLPLCGEDEDGVDLVEVVKKRRPDEAG